MTEKYKNLISNLKNAPLIIGDYLSTISSDDMNKKQRENFWTIRDHLAHLVQTQKMLYERILKFKNEDYPVIKPYFPENEGVEEENISSIESLIENFKSVRKNQIDILENLDAKDFNKSAVHDEYKKYNLEILMNHMLFHDYWHMYRIEELLLTKDEYLTEL